MGVPVLKVNGRDLSSYLDVQPEDGLDPSNPERITPQFSGSIALREGQGFVGESIGNRDWTIPLIIMAGSRPLMHRLIQDIQNDLCNGAQVEFATDGSVDLSTYFVLEKGELQIEYNYFVALQAATRATLKLWTRPHGSTGTVRTVASFNGTGPQSFLATGIIGDRISLANLEVRVGSSIASSGRVIGFGIHRNPSFNPIITASQITQQTAATVFSSATGIASTYLGVGVSPTAASGVAFQAFLSPVAAHVGRHRVMGVMRSRLNQGIIMYAKDRFGAVLGPTAQATQIDANKWQLVDLGEISVQSRASGQDDIPTQYLNLYAGGASGNTIVATYALNVAGLFLVNLDNSPGVLRSPGIAGNAFPFYDGFTGLQVDSAIDTHTADTGQPWNSILSPALGGNFYLHDYNGPGYGYVIAGGSLVGSSFVAIAGGYGAAALGSGAAVQDVNSKIGLYYYSPSAVVPSAYVEWWPKAISNATTVTDGVGARLTFAPSQTLQIITASGGATAIAASAGIATTLASGLTAIGYPNIQHFLALNIQGGLADVWIATSPGGSPALSASSAVISKTGWPVLRVQNSASFAYPYVDSVSVQSLPINASDIGPRQWFRFESYPQDRTYQGNASAFQQDQIRYFRGVTPRLPVTGSPGASGPVRVLVFEGEVDNFQGADAIDVRLDTLERFQFLR